MPKLVGKAGPPTNPRFYVRPGLRVFAATFLLLIAFGLTPLPVLVEHSLLAKRIMLVSGATAIALGWVWAARHREPIASWRLWIARTSAVYLTVSVPIYALDLYARVSLFVHHPWLWVITRPWGSWQGEALAWLVWLCSFSWRGRARIAFVVASTLLLLVTIIPSRLDPKVSRPFAGPDRKLESDCLEGAKWTDRDSKLARLAVLEERLVAVQALSYFRREGAIPTSTEQLRSAPWQPNLRHSAAGEVLDPWGAPYQVWHGPDRRFFVVSGGPAKRIEKTPDTENTLASLPVGTSKCVGGMVLSVHEFPPD